MSWRKLLLALSCIPVLARADTPGGEPPPTPAPAEQRAVGQALEEAMTLNRSGRWQEAAELADGLLARQDLPLLQQCEACFYAAYARVRLGRMLEAAAVAERFKAGCTAVTSTHWLNREMASLSAEIDRSKFVPEEKPPLRKTDPASIGLDPAILKEHEALCERTCADSCLILHGERILSEFYSPSFRPPSLAMSSTKSVTGLLVGLLIAEGKIESLDDPVSRYLAGWSEPPRSAVTLRHLLTHTSGLKRLWEDGVGNVTDKNAFVLGLEPTYPTGSRFEYSNEGVQLLSPILDKAAGQPIQRYAREKLFEPAGMTSTELMVDAKGHAWTYADMKTTPRDLALLGRLMLNGGKVGERRVVSRQWIEQSTQPSQELNQDYGLLWWLLRRPAGFAAFGYLNTNVYIFPAADLVVVRTQARPCETPESAYPREAMRLFERLVERLGALSTNVSVERIGLKAPETSGSASRAFR